MLRTLLLSGTVVLATAPVLTAQTQTVRWNDRASSGATAWDDEAPQVRVAIEGGMIGYGGPMRVRFEVSDNAYVTVVRVDSDGRMTILFPNSRNQRAAVRGDQTYYATNPRLGSNVTFFNNDRMGGYVFALASYSPLDLATFENRDFDRIGGYSQFTVANRSIARRPDVFIDRFAARVLWSVDTPYDYDVDYYSQFNDPYVNAYALCSARAFGNFYGYGMGYGPVGIGSHTFLAQFSSWERMAYPYFSLCNGFYDRFECISWLTMSVFASCLNNRYPLIARTPTDFNAGGLMKPVTKPGDPADSVPNVMVIRDGVFDPVRGSAGADDGTARFDRINRGTDLDGIMSIPSRATQKVKDNNAQRERGADDRRAATTAFDGGVTEKPSKMATADASARPPAREPTKAKGTRDPVRETRRTRNSDFGSTTRNTGSNVGSTTRERPRTIKAQGASGGGSTTPSTSLGGTSTADKKKPPKNQE